MHLEICLVCFRVCSWRLFGLFQGCTVGDCLVCFKGVQLKIFCLFQGCTVETASGVCSL